MSYTDFFEAQCNRCRQIISVSKLEYQREEGEIYCDECLCPFQCDGCGEIRYGIPEDIPQSGSITCRYCVETGKGRRDGLEGSQQNSATCALCGEQSNNLIQYQEAPNNPVCQECSPTFEQIIWEESKGIYNVVIDAVFYLIGMALYLLISVGVAGYLMSKFNLVWWVFYLILVIVLLAGAHTSRIFDPQEIIDLSYATTAITIVVTFVFYTSSLDFQLILGTVVIVAFLTHELSHKAVGIGFGNPARFTAFYTLNLATIGIAYFTGFLLLLPGGVQNVGITDRVWGIVAAAGPVSNILLAGIFVMLAGSFPELSRIGIIVNLALGGFNMLPISPFDGSKVLKWSPASYLLIVITVLLFGITFMPSLI